MQVKTKVKIAFFRFVRGAIAGATASMIGLNVVGVSTFVDLQVFLSSLGVAGAFGGITGGLLALDKYLRTE